MTSKELVLHLLKTTSSRYAIFKDGHKETRLVRPFIKDKPLVLAYEIYGNPNNYANEHECISCLNELETEGKVKALIRNGWLWYMLK